MQKEAVAIGKNDWAAAIASSGDWQILSTGTQMGHLQEKSIFAHCCLFLSWCVVCGSCFMDHGSWLKAHGLWLLVHGS